MSLGPCDICLKEGKEVQAIWGYGFVGTGEAVNITWSSCKEHEDYFNDKTPLEVSSCISGVE